MKKIILLTGSVFTFVLSAFSATPTYQSFNTNQFSNNGNQIWIEDGAKTTNQNLVNPTNAGGTYSNATFITGPGLGVKMSVTNLEGTNMVWDFYSMSNGQMTFAFSKSPGDQSYGSWKVNPGHDGAFTDTANVEFEFNTPGSFAFGAGSLNGGKGHIQWGVGFGKYWSYAQYGQVMGDLFFGSPWTWRAAWVSNGVTLTKHPGVVAVSTSTNGGWKFVFMHDLGNDGLDDWSTNNIDDAGSLYVKPGGAGKGWDFRGGTMYERQVATISSTNYALDFGRSALVDLTITTTNVFFTFTNDFGGATNSEHRTFVLRSGVTAPTLNWPADVCVLGPSAGGILPTNMASSQLIHLDVKSVGLGNSNKLVSASVSTDFAFVLDADAVAFFAAVGAGVLTTTETNAINNLVINAKDHQWWTNCDAIYPHVGNSNASRLNLKNVALYNMTWTGHAPTNFSAGAPMYDGIASYGDSGFTPSTASTPIYSQNSSHIFVYCTVDWSGDFSPIGAVGAGPSYSVIRTTGANTAQAWGPQYTGVTVSTAVGSDYRGPLMATRTSSSVTAIASRSAYGAGAGTATALPNVAIFLGAENNGGLWRPTATTIAGATIGGGMSQAQWDLFRADWDTFNAALGRLAP